MQIQHRIQGSKGAYYIEENNTVLAEKTFVMVGDQKMIIDHTEVSPKFRGTGTGSKLVLAAVEKARKENIRVIPFCPFVRAMFDKHPELGDVRN